MSYSVLNRLLSAIIGLLILCGLPNHVISQTRIRNFEIEGDWSGDWNDVFYYGPVITDLDEESEGKEFIIVDKTTLMVYENDGDLLFDAVIPDEDFEYLHIAAVGRFNISEDLNGQGIVLCSTDIRNGYWYGKLFIYNDIGDLVAESDEFNCAGIPQTADIYGGEEGSYDEDGNDEIIIFGHFAFSMGKLIVFEVSLNGEDIEINMMDFVIEEYQFCKIAAIGDMNRDGKKEIVLCHDWEINLFTFDPTEEDPIDRQWDWDRPDENGAGWRQLGPILADFHNDGDLEIIALRDRGFNENPRTVLDVISYDPEGPELDPLWDADENHLEEGFGEDPYSEWLTLPCIGDFQDNGELTFGTGMNDDSDGRLFWRTHENELLPGASEDWPRDIDYREFAPYFPSLARIGTDNLDKARIVATDVNDDHEIWGILPENDNEEDKFDFELVPEAGFNTFKSCAAVTHIDDNDDLDVCVRAFNAAKTIMRIYVWEFEDCDPENPLLNVEWSQLGNGPRHTNLYAQTYEGTYDSEYIYWRDRVIVTGDVVLDWDNTLVTTGKTPTVVEFNDETTLYVGNWMHWLGDYPHVFKGNSPGNRWDLVFIEPPEPPEPPWPPYYPGDLSVQDGGIIIESGGDVTLENWTFTGATDGIGDHIAISAEDAEVNLINCTFKGYDIAVMFDNCTGTIEGCTFEDANYNAVELYDCLSGIAISECVFTDNDGAAIFLSNSSSTIEECEIYDNDCDIYGAAIYS